MVICQVLCEIITECLLEIVHRDEVLQHIIVIDLKATLHEHYMLVVAGILLNNLVHLLCNIKVSNMLVHEMGAV